MTEISAADKDYSKQVLERFGKRHSSFVTQFTILIIFALSFIAFVLAPMIALKLDADRLDTDLTAKEGMVAGLQQKADGFKSQRDELTGEQDIVNGELTSLNFVQERYRVDAEETARQIKEKHALIATIRNENVALDARRVGLTTVSERLVDVQAAFDPTQRTDELRAWFRELVNQARDPACADDQQIGYLGCMVRRKLSRDWEVDFARIDIDVITPLRSSEPEAATAVEQRTLEAREAFTRRLNENPDFWQTVNEKEVFMDQLGQEFELAFSDVREVLQSRQENLASKAVNLADQIEKNAAQQAQLDARLADIAATQRQIVEDQKDAEARMAEFEAQQSKLTAESDALDAEMEGLSAQIESDRAVLEATRASIAAEQKKIADRLSQFQSPFGTLPLGLNEATLAFPFVLAVGFLICALLQTEVLRLRGEYHGMMRAQAGSIADQAQATHRVTVLAPLWLDPMRPAWISLAAAALLTLPALAFLLTVALSLGGVLQLAEAGTTERFLRPFYLGLYAFGAVLVLVGVWRVWVTWRGYRGRVGV